jgi:hypothetical protein
VNERERFGAQKSRNFARPTSADMSRAVKAGSTTLRVHLLDVLPALS